MADSPVRGQFLWHELITTDTRSAGAFYGRIVGWKTETYPHNPAYTIFTLDRPRAGMMALTDQMKGMPPMWQSYIGTPNVDDTARQAVSLGGKILKPADDIPTVGRFAVIADPQGAVFIPFTPLPVSGQGMTPTSEPAAGDFSWHELATSDWQGALKFYKALFGWEETSAMDMGPGMGTYQMFGLKGRPLGGMFNKQAQMPGPPSWLPYILVADSKKTVEVVKQAGGRIINGPMEVPGGDWIAQGLDLQGATFAVHSLKAAAAQPPAAPKAAAKTAAPKKAAPKKPAAKKAAPKKAARKKVAKKVAKKATKKATGKKKASKKKPAAKKTQKTKKRAGKKR